MLGRYEQPVANGLVEKRSRIRKSPETLTEKVRQVRFDATFVIELFLMQVIGGRLKQVIVSKSQV